MGFILGMLWDNNQQSSPGPGAGVAATEVLQGHRNLNLGQIFLPQAGKFRADFLARSPRFGVSWGEKGKVWSRGIFLPLQSFFFYSPGSPLSTEHWGRRLWGSRNGPIPGGIPHLSQSSVCNNPLNSTMSCWSTWTGSQTLPDLLPRALLWNNNTNLGMGNVELIPFPACLHGFFFPN